MLYKLSGLVDGGQRETSTFYFDTEQKDENSLLHRFLGRYVKDRFRHQFWFNRNKELHSFKFSLKKDIPEVKKEPKYEQLTFKDFFEK
jgi:hypothetical protein